MSSPSESGDVEPSPARAAPWITAILGLNVWLIAVAIPALVLGVRSLAVAAGGTSAVLALGLGLGLRARAHRAAVACLLGVFPATVIATAAAIDRASGGQAYSALGVVLGTLALLAFGAAAMAAADETRRSLLRHARPLGTGTPVTSDARRRPRRALLAIAAAGGFFVAVVAPIAGSDYAESWPGSARQSGTFVAVVAGVLGVATVAGLVGGTLRAKRAEGSRARRLGIAALVGVGLGIAIFLAVR